MKTFKTNQSRQNKIAKSRDLGLYLSCKSRSLNLMRNLRTRLKFIFAKKHSISRKFTRARPFFDLVCDLGFKLPGDLVNKGLSKDNCQLI